jgi:hypothetical protein
MSMPKFPDCSEILTRDEAINAILTSIAMEETALSHILNAEGEKIQHVLANKCASVCEVVTVNDSVAFLVEKIVDLQLILKMKMQLAKDFLPLPCPCSDCNEPDVPTRCRCHRHRQRKTE